MEFFGRGDWIRTSGLYVPNVALYQAEPHLEKFGSGSGAWLRKKDSNPHIQSQSLLCYLYTIPQYMHMTLKQQDLLYQTTRICQSPFKPFSSFSAFGRQFCTDISSVAKIIRRKGKPAIRFHFSGDSPSGADVILPEYRSPVSAGRRSAFHLRPEPGRSGRALLRKARTRNRE